MSGSVFWETGVVVLCIEGGGIGAGGTWGGAGMQGGGGGGGATVGPTNSARSKLPSLLFLNTT